VNLFGFKAGHGTCTKTASIVISAIVAGATQPALDPANCISPAE
jgi:hypothetical protein